MDGLIGSFFDTFSYYSSRMADKHLPDRGKVSSIFEQGKVKIATIFEFNQ